MRLILPAAVALALSGCTTLEERQRANNGFDYLEQGRAVDLSVPKQLDKPDFSGDYAIPEVGNNAPKQAVGNKLKIVSPSLVLPMVSGSHVEEGSKSVQISFDKIDESRPLDEAIWASLINYLSEQGIGVESFDKQNQTLITDWVIEQASLTDGWLDWSPSTKKEGKRFEFSLLVKPHGRTATLKAELIDYMQTLNGRPVIAPDSEDKRRYAVEVLNKVIGHYAYEMRLAEANRLATIRRGFSVELGSASKTGTPLVIDAQYSNAWPRLLLVLRKLGFDIQDLDQSNGLIFAKYAGPQTGWFAGLFGSDDALPLAKKPYRIEVTGSGDKTRVVLMDNENNPLAAELVQKIYPKFSDFMARDDLDI